MNFFIYLPIAASSVNIFLLLGLGGLVGFLSGLFGVGGGFLLTPLLIMFGIPPTVAAASDSNQIVAASASGTYAHYRLGNVDFKMGLVLLIGGVLGGTLGVQLVKVLRATGNADFVIKITYVAMLGIIGGYMFVESLQSLKKTPLTEERGPAGEKKPSFYARLMTSLPFKINFDKSGIHISFIVPLLLGGLVGILAAIMGVGGGFIMVPIMVYLLRMPMHVVVGTSLFQIFFTCVNVTIMQAHINHSVDFILALILLVGSSCGAQIGTRISKRLKGDQIKILLAVIIMVVMVQMLYGLVVSPKLLLSYKGGH
ncbi:MAG TPA: sulfite exporter TauE/SafE family protein [Thermodesulfobacteriota bacterium]|nr:sulfite exporter TauE/SafE family protein [Thermodesulfobacteriota bacterium]